MSRYQYRRAEQPPVGLKRERQHVEEGEQSRLRQDDGNDESRSLPTADAEKSRTRISDRSLADVWLSATSVTVLPAYRS